MIFIPIALLALAGGMFLLAKTRKEDLGRFFEFISYFIIIASFLIMSLAIIHCFTKILVRRACHLQNHECIMETQNQIPQIGKKFSHHEEMEGMNGCYKMRKDGKNDTTIENHCNHRLNRKYDWEIGEKIGPNMQNEPTNKER